MSRGIFFELLEFGVTVQFFDMEDPLFKLKNLLDDLWNTSLADYSVWLQDTQLLDESKNLIEDGIDGEGKFQIILQLKIRDGIKAINIIDVLKTTYEESLNEFENPDESVPWIESREFSTERVRLGISDDVELWNVDNVRFWMKWAIRTFNLANVDIEPWRITGREVKQLTVEGYQKLIPFDPDNQFWMDLQVLQKCGQVAVRLEVKSDLRQKQATFNSMTNNYSTPNMVLCKFLLNLLTDAKGRHVISWVNNEGEFKFTQPDIVAKLWGEHRQNTDMTNDKMTRALRRHYANIIAKVTKKKFIYRFNFDVQEMLGYLPMELYKILNDP